MELGLTLVPGRGWSHAQACAIGTSHAKSGAPCQDYASAVLRDQGGSELLVVVVCDGAGSAAHSDVASHRVACELTELVFAHLDEGARVADLTREIVMGWVEQVRDDLAQHAREFKRTLRDYACTLLCAIVGEDAAAFFQIGDGAIVVSHGTEDGWSWVFWPQHGEYMNSTNFVVSANMPEVLEFELAPRRVDELAVFTDGIENLVLQFANKSVHAAFFDQMFEPLRRAGTAGCDERLCAGLAQYLSSPTICSKTDDDKTLVMATRWRP